IPGDKILAINGNSVSNWEELHANLFIHTLGEDLIVEVERKNGTKILNIPRSVLPADESQAMFLIAEGVRPMVGAVLEDSPALRSGFNAGDIILSVNDTEVYSSAQVIDIVSAQPLTEISVTVNRGEEIILL